MLLDAVTAYALAVRADPDEARAEFYQRLNEPLVPVEDGELRRLLGV